MRPTVVALLLLMLLVQLQALQIVPAGSVLDGTLDAMFEPSSARPDQRADSAVVAAEVRPAVPMKLYLAEREGADWRILREIGTVNGTSFVYFSVDVSYAGKSDEVRRYMLIGEADGRYYGKEFVMVLDWRKYESTVRDSITNANVLLVPLLSIAMVLMLLLLFEFAYVRKDRSGAQGEYTTSSLFFPVMRQRPTSEVVASLFINPVFLFFELACVGVFAMVMLGHGIELYGNSVGLQLFFLSGVGALSVPLMYMALSWLADVYERGPLRFTVAAFIWGMFAALASFLANSLFSAVMNVYIGPEEVAMGSLALIGTAMVAPAVEEFGKGLGILILSGHHQYKDMTDGLLYGFAIGVGFSFLENWFYFVARANPFELGLGTWVEFITYRLLFNSMAHGAFTASCGAFVGYFKSKPGLRPYAQAAFLPGVLIAIALHALFNISAILDEVAIYAVRMPVFIFNPIMVVVLAAALAVLFYFATINTKNRVLAEKARAGQT